MMAIQPRRDEAAFECEIHRSDNYIERLSLRPISALPAQVLLEISSQLLTAKDPQENRVRYRAMVPRERIEQLHDLLTEWRRSATSGYQECVASIHSAYSDGTTTGSHE